MLQNKASPFSICINAAKTKQFLLQNYVRFDISSFLTLGGKYNSNFFIQIQVALLTVFTFFDYPIIFSIRSKNILNKS